MRIQSSASSNPGPAETVFTVRPVASFYHILMKTSVIACANSRLHADVMLIRLRRAGIACRNISALVPHASMPNSVACWLRMDQALTVRLGQEMITPAGRIRRRLPHDADAGAMIDTLIAAGIDRPSALALEEKLEQGHILLAVSAGNEDEAAIAWHVFKHGSAELLVVGHAKEKNLPAAPDQHVTVATWSAVAA